MFTAELCESGCRMGGVVGGVGTEQPGLAGGLVLVVAAGVVVGFRWLLGQAEVRTLR